MLGEVLQVETDMEAMAATATNRFCDNWEREVKSGTEQDVPILAEDALRKEVLDYKRVAAFSTACITPYSVSGNCHPT